jgi:hypothetical protein
MEHSPEFHRPHTAYLYAAGLIAAVALTIYVFALSY